MGNQQERLIWLAGFIDGEGYLGAKRREHKEMRPKRSNKVYLHVTPRCVISNTSVETLRFIESIMEENGFSYYVRWADPSKSPQDHKMTRWGWKIEITGIKRMKRFLERVTPYLVTKRNQAEALYDFCKRRVDAVGDGNDTRNAELTESDFKIVEVVKKLNQNPQRLYAETGINQYVRNGDFRKI